MYPVATQGSDSLVWERSTKLGLTQVHDGYAVTLDAAYADAAQTMLAVSVVDSGGRHSQISTGRTVLTDEAGHVFNMVTGVEAPADSSSSVSMTWFETPGDGTLSGIHHLLLSLPDISVRDEQPAGNSWRDLAGPWNFEFDLAIAPGTLVSLASTASAQGITVTLESALVTPSTVRLKWIYSGLPAAESIWMSELIPVFMVVHNGVEIAGGMSESNVLDPAGVTTAITETGADDASGSWTVRIDELIHQDPNGQTRLQGPWELRFTVPSADRPSAATDPATTRP
jgi:hypothetical protein